MIKITTRMFDCADYMGMQVIMRSYMKERNLSQKEFAEILDISPQYLNDVLKARRNIPDKILDFFKLERKEIYIPK